jgi:serine/threonine protein phosphatase 1
MIAVIGDVHGCYYTLSKLYNEINSKYPDIPVYCVGDLVDRGKHSFEVVQFIMENRIVFTPGNHDYMFYYFIKHPSSPIGRSWIYNGSESTLDSYSNRFNEMNIHLNYIIRAPLYINIDDCFISHAGISSYYSRKLGKKPLEDIQNLTQIVEGEVNSEHGVLWTRDKLLNLGKLQIVGHTRFVDTSACSGNRLSCAIIEKNELKDILSVKTIPKDIE